MHYTFSYPQLLLLLQGIFRITDGKEGESWNLELGGQSFMGQSVLKYGPHYEIPLTPCSKVIKVRKASYLLPDSVPFKS